ncbi:MAG: riboflavin synthase [Chitinophagales bacterium]|nr:riboflavin synthase [Chitinophagales bacterium]
MFTGIIESLGEVVSLASEGSNLHITVRSEISPQLKIDQSLAHNGACLTVVALEEHAHTVTAISETLAKTNVGSWQVGSIINLERAMPTNGRYDGHIVQGHVDAVGVCKEKITNDGSWVYRFGFEPKPTHLVVEKGSICIDGVSLTVVEATENEFSVAIIPYTYNHTTFQVLKVGDKVNLEFDIIGKYLASHFKAYQQS